MTKQEAQQRFRALVRLYGLFWEGRNVPAEAWAEMAEINTVLLTEADRREALGLNNLWKIPKVLTE